MCGHDTRATQRRDPALRVSDADRESTADLIRSHAAEGRLDYTELAERVERALGATTYGDLQALTADLPKQTAAGKDARARVEFRDHLRSYLAVMALLVAIWAVSDLGGYFWPIWPMLGWGIGIASHASGFRARRGSKVLNGGAGA
jgi:hypothetical protein